MKSYILKNAKFYENGRFISSDVFVSKEKTLLLPQDAIGVISAPSEAAGQTLSEAEVFDFNNCIIIPGLIDVHVHLREPGFLYKETIGTGTLAAARGGFSAVCSMPNLNPTPDDSEALAVQEKAIANDAVIRVFPFGTITRGEKGQELSDIEALADRVIGFSDDGIGVADPAIMEAAMYKIKATGKVLAAHCEDMTLRAGGYIHAGKYAEVHGHAGISSESEWLPIKRDIELVKKTGCKYHVCHVSAKESVELIRQAKKEGVDITCETAPHYLVLSDSDLQEHGRFKMNPPIRSAADREALIEGILDGTIDMIATDHAPHSAEEKSKGLRDSLMGVVGLETSFPIIYTEFVKKGIFDFAKLIELMCYNPAKRFGIPIRPGDLTVFDLNASYNIDPTEFLSLGRSTPFEGRPVYGACKMTLSDGEIVYRK